MFEIDLVYSHKVKQLYLLKKKKKLAIFSVLKTNFRQSAVFSLFICSCSGSGGSWSMKSVLMVADQFVLEPITAWQATADQSGAGKRVARR